MKRIAILAPHRALEMSVGMLRDVCWMATIAALNNRGDCGDSSRDKNNDNNNDSNSENYGENCGENRATSHKATTIESEAHNWLQVLSSDGLPVTSFTGGSIAVDGSFTLLEQADAIFIATFGDSPDNALRENQTLIEILPRLRQLGCPIIGVSTSAYFLAEAGLLDGKVATVYPNYAEDFYRRYPQVQLRASRIITNAGNLFCSNGIPSTLDLCMAIIEQLYSPEIVRKIDDQILLGFKRNYEHWHFNFDQYKYHSDHQILTAQQHLERHYGERVSLQELAADIGMSPRNFTRRFKLATDVSPQEYLHSLRISAARELLKTTGLRINEVAFQVGYADVSSFNKQFKKSTGQSPKDFRE